jgi:hypothetical protein
MLTFMLGAIVAAKLATSITKPINTLVNATRMIASGDFGYMVLYRDKTELGELARCRRLALAVQAEQSVDGARLHGETHAAQRLRPLFPEEVPADVGLLQPDDFNHFLSADYTDFTD